MSVLGLLPASRPENEAVIRALFAGNALANYLMRREEHLVHCACGAFTSDPNRPENHRMCCPVARWIRAVEEIKAGAL